MTWLCIACSAGGAVAFAAAFSIFFIVETGRGGWPLTLLVILFFLGIGSCSVEDRMCAVAGLNEIDQ